MDNPPTTLKKKGSVQQNRVDNYRNFLKEFDPNASIEFRLERISTYANGFRFGLPGEIAKEMILGLIHETKHILLTNPDKLQYCQAAWMHLVTGRVTNYDAINEVINLLWFFEQHNTNNDLSEFVSIAILSNYDNLEAWNIEVENNIHVFKTYMYDNVKNREHNHVGPYELFLSKNVAQYLNADELANWLINIENTTIRTIYCGCLLEHLPTPNKNDLWNTLNKYHPSILQINELLPDPNAIRRPERSYQAWWRYTTEMIEQSNFIRLKAWVGSWNAEIGSELAL